ncbi:MAG: hypothetical protein V4672_15540 [Verrucomicrobiota bacterium]
MKMHPAASPVVLESLETRLAPAGIVSLTISGGILTITGDADPNGITITEDPIGNDWDISDALTGTTFVLNGVEQTGPFSIQAQQGIKVSLGDGDDSFQFLASENPNATVLTKGLSVLMGAGNDTFVFGSTFNHHFSIAGNTTVDMGAGNDILAMTSSAYFIGPVKMLMGVGDDTVIIGVSGEHIYEKGLTLDLGAGDDRLTAFGGHMNVTGGAFTIKAAGGPGSSPEISLALSELSVSGLTTIALAGNATLSVGTNVSHSGHFGGGLKITGSTGFENVSFEGKFSSAKAILFDLKESSGNITWDANGSLHGTTLTVKGGSGSDSFIQSTGHSMILTGALSLNLGAGSNGWSGQAGSTLTASSVSYVGGAGNDSVQWSGASLQVLGNMSFAMGDSTGDNKVVLKPTVSGRIGGALNITALNGNDDVEINSPDFRILGGINLKLGNGDNNTSLAGAAFRLDGALNYTGGTGEDILTSTQTNMVIGKGLVFKPGSGSNTLSLTPQLGSIGAVTYTGAAGADVLTLGNTNGTSTTQLIVHGHVNAAMAAGQSEINITDADLYGNLIIKTPTLAAETDLLILKQSTFNGLISITQGAGNSSADFAEVIARSAVNLNAGAGDNSILMDAAAGSFALSHWFGTVKMITGAGNDTIAIGSSPTVASAGNIFHRDITVDDGTGTDAFTEGNNTFLSTSTLP